MFVKVVESGKIVYQLIVKGRVCVFQTFESNWNCALFGALVIPWHQGPEIFEKGKWSEQIEKSKWMIEKIFNQREYRGSYLWHLHQPRPYSTTTLFEHIGVGRVESLDLI
uniref:Uncharacterized protein n=1 Tax=Cacopsylla melanoneura TaxID=428564 RepID=A0A8D8LQK2_9HEMI